MYACSATAHNCSWLAPAIGVGSGVSIVGWALGPVLWGRGAFSRCLRPGRSMFPAPGTRPHRVRACREGGRGHHPLAVHVDPREGWALQPHLWACPGARLRGEPLPGHPGAWQALSPGTAGEGFRRAALEGLGCIGAACGRPGWGWRAPSILPVGTSVIPSFGQVCRGHCSPAPTLNPQPGSVRHPLCRRRPPLPQRSSVRLSSSPDRTRCS